MNPENWQDLLREAHNDPIDPAHYAAVRARVLSSVGLLACPSRAKPGRLFHFAWITAAAVLLLVIALRPPRVPQPPRITLAIPPAPPAPIARPRPHPVQVVARTPQPHHDPLTIKLQTSDPNIVIYWIAD